MKMPTKNSLALVGSKFLSHKMRFSNNRRQANQLVRVLKKSLGSSLTALQLDLGWLIYMHRFFEDIAASAGLPGLPDFLERERIAQLYEQLSGHRPRDLDWYTLYAALRYAIIGARIHLRQVHFGEAERPADPDALIPNRAALEAMLAGSYWHSARG